MNLTFISYLNFFCKVKKIWPNISCFMCNEKVNKMNDLGDWRIFYYIQPFYSFLVMTLFMLFELLHRLVWYLLELMTSDLFNCLIKWLPNIECLFLGWLDHTWYKLELDFSCQKFKIPALIFSEKFLEVLIALLWLFIYRKFYIKFWSLSYSVASGCSIMWLSS